MNNRFRIRNISGVEIGRTVSRYLAAVEDLGIQMSSKSPHPKEQQTLAYSDAIFLGLEHLKLVIGLWLRLFMC